MGTSTRVQEPGLGRRVGPGLGAAPGCLGCGGQCTHLQQQPVDLLGELLDAGLWGLFLQAQRSREHVLI